MEGTTSDREEMKENMEFETKDNEIFRKVMFEPIRIGPVSTLEEMDCQVLQFRNKKLEMKLEDYHRIENELQLRMEQLEKRQSQDKFVMNILNRFWNHLNEDMKTMLLEFDDECQNAADEIENETTLSFIKMLTACNEPETDEKLLQNVEMSTSALTTIIQAYDHILKINDQTVAALKSLPDNTPNTYKNTDDLEELLSFDKNTFLLNKLHQSIEDVDHLKKAVKNSYNTSCGIGCEYLYPNSRLSNCSHSLEKTPYKTEIESNFEVVTNVKSATNSLKKNKRLKLSNSNELRKSANAQHASTNQTIDFTEKTYNNENETSNLSEIDSSIKQVVAEILDQIVNKFENSGSAERLTSEFSNISEIDENGDEYVFTNAVDVTNETENTLNSTETDNSDNTKYHEKLSAIKMTSDRMKEKLKVSITVLKELRNVCTDITSDNARLQNIVSSFQKQYVQLTVNDQNIVEALKFKELEYEEWKILVDEIEYENEKLKYRKFKMERNLAEAADTLEKLKVSERNREKSESSSPYTKKFDELQELDLQRNIALNRSQELESLRAKYQSNLDLIEELEKNLNDLPENVIEGTAEYKYLQSQFSILYNDTMQIKDQIEEYYAHIQTLNATFVNKIEMSETEDLMMLRKLQTDLLQMQQVNTQLRREYQMLKIEFERNLVANEQTGPLNKEMRYLLVRLQKHNKHLKNEAQRYKRRYQELNVELNMLSKQSYTDPKFKVEAEDGSRSDFDENDYALDMNDDFMDFMLKEEPLDVKKEKLDPEFDDHLDVPVSLYDQPIMAIAIKQEPEISSPDSPSSIPSQSCHQNHVNTITGPPKTCQKLSRKRRRDAIEKCREVLSRRSKKLREFPEIEDMEDEKLFEDEYVQDLKNQLKKAELEQKELKLLLDMYKGINRDKREKMQLLHAEKKLKADIEETKTQMRRILEIKRENRKKLADENALRKIKYLEEQNFLLLRQINIHKQEEEALLSEMEVTNQAFEDMQEQNSRLIQHLREKDDANSKLMAERIKSNLLYKITREEKESLLALISATTKQLDSVTTVMNELEEKEQVYQTAINNVEKEINLRQQVLELHRKKALEYAQSTSELKLSLEKYLADMKEVRQQITEKSSSIDTENFKYNRLQEEVALRQRRIECLKKIEPLETPDVVLVEAVREYKEMLTCQSCKIRRKDAVLSKCFHVFCWECLRTRYETRQRKCPKCNATFGANDYHRLFFAN